MINTKAPGPRVPSAICLSPPCHVLTKVSSHLWWVLSSTPSTNTQTATGPTRFLSASTPTCYFQRMSSPAKLTDRETWKTSENWKASSAWNWCTQRTQCLMSTCALRTISLGNRKTTTRTTSSLILGTMQRSTSPITTSDKSQTHRLRDYMLRRVFPTSASCTKTLDLTKIKVAPRSVSISMNFKTKKPWRLWWATRTSTWLRKISRSKKKQKRRNKLSTKNASSRSLLASRPGKFTESFIKKLTSRRLHRFCTASSSPTAKTRAKQTSSRTWCTSTTSCWRQDATCSLKTP